MKLILSSGGGVTGLRKTHSVDTDGLDSETRAALHAYLTRPAFSGPRNFGDTWRLENGPSASIDPKNLDPRLRSLYERMSRQLTYPPPVKKPKQP